MVRLQRALSFPVFLCTATGVFRCFQPNISRTFLVQKDNFTETDKKTVEETTSPSVLLVEIPATLNTTLYLRLDLTYHNKIHNNLSDGPITLSSVFGKLLGFFLYHISFFFDVLPYSIYCFLSPPLLVSCICLPIFKSALLRAISSYTPPTIISNPSSSPSVLYYNIFATRLTVLP